MKINPIVYGICLALSPSIGFSQELNQESGIDKPTKDVEVITVTGIRSGLLQAIDVKKESSSIVDAVVASDIGEFPDHNIADTLQRVSGVQVSRGDRGSAERVSIRGLPSSLTKVLYNGQSISSIAVGDTPLREFSFNSLPSDFASSIVVHKSTSADLSEGGMSGTVNVKTHRAFDKSERVVLFSAKAVYDQKSEDTSPEFTALWSDLFNNDTFGATLGVSYVEQKQGVQRYRTLKQKLQKESKDKVDYNGDGDTADSIGINAGLKFEDFPIERKRLSTIANLEYRPADNLKVFGEVFYSKLDIEAARNTLTADPRKAKYVDGTQVVSVFNEQEYISSADAIQGKVFSQTQGQLRDGDMTVAILEAEYFLNEWSFNPSIAYTESSTSLTKWNVNSNNLKADYLYNAATGMEAGEVVFNEDDAILTTKDNFSLLKASGDFFRTIENSTFNAEFNVARELELELGRLLFTDFSFGLNYAVNDIESDGTDLTLNAASFEALGFTGSDGLTLANNDNIGQYYAPDTLSILKDFSQAELKAAGNYSNDEGDAINVEEENIAAFVRVDFEGLDGDFSGNIGVRYVETDETIKGNVADLSAGFSSDVDGVLIINSIDNVERNRSYNEFLPSLNLRYDLNEDHLLRFGAGKTLTRADYGDLSIFVDLKQGETENKINTSDPGIEPWLADNYDVSYEWYFDDESMFSAALFYKDIESLTGTVERTEQYNVTNFDGVTTVEDFEVKSNSNLEGVTVKGAELSFQMPFSFLPGMLSSTGVRANYTYVDNSAPERLRAASKNNYNLMFYYSGDSLNAKISYTYRDGYLLSLSEGVVPAIYNEARGNLSASVKYQISENVSVNLSGTNLTDEADVKYYEGVNWNNQFIDYGRRFTLGVKVKL